MKTIKVTVSRNYDVLVGSGLLQKLGQYAKALTKAQSIAIVSDSNVWPLYGKSAIESFQAAGYESILFYVLPAGEESKNGENYLKLLNFLAEHQLTRSDCLVALGGGVVGDMTGFVAATYLRGIDYIQVPTTILAAVDSSVGGKTAIDLAYGKNLVGAFYQPILVLCDIDTLNTLPEDIFRDGCAEIIKYGILYDPALFEHLQEHLLDFDRETVIARCVELKRNVVATDEFDRGARQKLNLGHTIGHSVEANSSFMVSHGKAVAIGMAIVSRASVKFGLCSIDTAMDIEALLRGFSLPTQTTDPAADLYRIALSDKKRYGDTVNLIVPVEIGNCIIHTVTTQELETFIEAGLSYGYSDFSR